ncbi:hypothetical protein B5S32_g3586 [[Candida] boidinii]|nr:hypothetical protein B5S32_g3586 [[Candida] boidinii]
MEASLSNTVTFIYENNVPKEYSVGIDLLFFGTSPDSKTNKQSEQTKYQPKGIKLVPAGIHIVHLTNSLINYRIARYVECSEGDVFIIKFNDTSSGTSNNNNKNDSNTHLSSLDITFFKNIKNEFGSGNNNNDSNKLINEFNKLISILPFMINFENCLENFKIPFPNSPNSNIYTIKNWSVLTQGLTINKISKFIIKASDIQNGSSIEILNDVVDVDAEKKSSELICTDDSSVDEYKKLQKVMGLDKEQNKRFTNDESSLNLLNLTDLDWRNTIRKHKGDLSNIKQITKDYLDKTWFFNNTFGNNKFNFLIELKFTFLNSIVLNNFNSLNHWIEMIKIVLNMKNFFLYDKDPTSYQFLSQFLSLIYLQLSIIPLELVSNKNESQEQQQQQQQQSLNSISIEKKLKTDFSKFLSTLDEIARIDLQLSYNSIIQLLELKFDIFVYQLLDEEDDKDEIEEDFIQAVYDQEMGDANDLDDDDDDDDGDDYNDYSEYLQFD